MDLAHPQFLWLLAVVPLLVLLIVRGRRRRARQFAALGQGGRELGDGGPGWLAAIVLLIVALTEPRWGRVPAPPLPPGRDIVLAVDTSRSMAAEDAVPDRLDVAVETAIGLVTALARERGNRAAVVAFAGRGVLRCPLTENLGAVIDVLRTLRPGDVRPGGTNLGAALNAAVAAFGDQEQAGGRTILLFSDGEDHAETWDAAIDRLRGAGVIVHAVAVGDADRGHPVPSGRGGSPMTYQGAPVLSRRSDQALTAIARSTGGAVIPVGLAPLDLGDLYVRRIEPVARQKREELRVRLSERAEQFSWFVLAALAFGLAGSWPGRRSGWLPVPFRSANRLRWIGVATGLALVGQAAGPPPPMTAQSAVEAGRAAYAAGRWVEALAAFERAIALEPVAPIPHYDAAATLFQMKQYAAAQEQYGEAAIHAGRALRTKIDYALGNTALALGDPPAAIRHYDACIASTAAGAELDAVRRDAAINRRFAEESARQSPAPKRPGPGSAPEEPSRRPRQDREHESKPGARSDAPGQGSGDRRGAGGAGGSGTAPRGTGVPEQLLEEEVERIRESRRHKLSETPAPDDARDNHKDW